MEHNCCSEYCRYPLKPPAFPPGLAKYLSPHLAELYNKSSYAFRDVELQDSDIESEKSGLDNMPAISLPISELIPSRYITSFYPIIGGLSLLVVILLVMRVSMFFHGKIPKSITQPISRGCLTRNDSLHEYDAIGMTTTEVTEISPVFICLQPYQDSVSKRDDPSCSNTEKMQSSRRSSPIGSFSFGEDSAANERCSSVLSSSTNNEFPSGRRNTRAPLTTEPSAQGSFTSSSIYSAISQCNNKFNKRPNPVDGVLVMASPLAIKSQTGCSVSGSEDRNWMGNTSAQDANKCSQERKSTAVSRMNENGSVSSMLSNPGPFSPSNRYISC